MHKLKKYLNPISLSLAFIVITLFYCSKDDDKIEISCSTTFLECLDGSVWTNESQTIFYRFNNNLNNPVERWGICQYSEGYVKYSDDFDVVLNTVDRLTLQYEIEYLGTYNYFLKLDGNEITHDGDYCPFSSLSCYYTMKRTIIDVDNFSGCN